MRVLGFIGLVFFFVSACKETGNIYVSSQLIPITDTISPKTNIDSIISPYRTAMDEQMSKVLGYAACDHQKERPEGNLGNLVADLVFENALIDFKDSSGVRIITLLNHGGLRAPINKGEIQLRNVYELMPFDNEIVYLKLRAEKFSEIYSYLKVSGGEPFSGFSNADSLSIIDFWVVTSDYLADGGDRMNFFLEPLAYHRTGRLLRDEIINYISQTDTICVSKDGRWR